MLKPKISVVMAVYNGGELLNKTVTSILHQTFEDFEFIIVDDCSTDETRQAVSSFDDPRIVLACNEKNIGQTRSLNVGLRMAKGKYIARIDAGDIFLAEKLEKQLDHIERYPDIAVLGTSAFRYDDSGTVIDVVHMPRTSSAIMQRIFFASPLVHISVIMNREVIMKTGGYDEDYHVLADYELWSRLLWNGFRLTSINNILAGYLVSPNSFGNINASGRSVMEAVNIIKANAEHLAGCAISADEARKIYTFFAFNMTGLTLGDIQRSENLFRKFIKEVNGSNSDANYYIAKKKLQVLLTRLHGKQDRKLFAYVLKSLLLRGGLFLSPSKVGTDLKSAIDRYVWRKKYAFSL